MSRRLPLLLVIPHGGCEVPDELAGYENISMSDIFFDSDAGANVIFNSAVTTEMPVNTSISRLFVDPDREFSQLHPKTGDGVIKIKTSMNRDVFKKNCYPDEIAISNILDRYYFPFHESVRSAVNRKKTRLIIECHTHAAVGPLNSGDPGMPRPLVITGYTPRPLPGMNKAAAPEIAIELAAIIGRLLMKEGDTVADKFRAERHDSSGCLMELYGPVVPMIYLSVSRALFLNDRDFSLEDLTIDQGRLLRLGKIISSGLEKFCARFM
ncbi:MAG TPA: N-formylglutamate amidohydrolase [Spirochaetota bacterium]|nr:N-formylglutamate amidohydrolase [Spirochaetota bacterium]